MQIKRLRNLFEVPPAYSFHGETKVDLEVWKSKVISQLKSMIIEEPVLPLKPIEKEFLPHSQLVAHEFLFEGFANIRIKGILLLPDKKGPHPFLLVCPGRFADFRKTAGFDSKRFPDEDIANRLAKEGFATLTLDYGLTSSIDPALLGKRDEADIFAITALMLGFSPLAFLIRDFLGCLAWASEQSEIDSDRLGIFGRSMGSEIAIILALIYEKPLVLALSSFLGYFKTIYTRQFVASGAVLLLGLYRYFDFPDLVSALTPNPLHIQHGENDPYYPVAEALEGMKIVNKSYAIAERSKYLDFKLTNAGHGTNIEYVIDFFRRHFS